MLSSLPAEPDVSDDDSNSIPAADSDDDSDIDPDSESQQSALRISSVLNHPKTTHIQEAIDKAPSLTNLSPQASLIKRAKPPALRTHAKKARHGALAHHSEAYCTQITYSVPVLPGTE